MKRALQLAEQGCYTTTPNPRVACVIIKDQEIIGEGWHEKAGEPHAEILAIREAQKRFPHKIQDSVLYVTLEPCCHFGRTPPCTEAIIQSGIKKVVVAMLDPNPLVQGKGIAQLRQAGVNVTVGILEKKAQFLNRGFIQRMTHNRPWVTLKMAMSLDGKTALSNGMSQWISGEKARFDVHHWRAKSCAVLTGINTILQDDAQMNVRLITTSRQPLRIVLDSRLQLPISAKIIDSTLKMLLVFYTQDNPIKRKALESLGVVCIENDNRNLRQLLKRLAEEFMLNYLLVEAGQTLATAFIEADLVDEIILYIAPTFLGEKARNLFALPERTNLMENPSWVFQNQKKLGKDLRIRLAKPVLHLP